MDCATHRGDEGVVGTWVECSVQGDVRPRILVARSALVDEESRRTVHLVSRYEEEFVESIVISTAPL